MASWGQGVQGPSSPESEAVDRVGNKDSRPQDTLGHLRGHGNGGQGPRMKVSVTLESIGHRKDGSQTVTLAQTTPGLCLPGLATFPAGVDRQWPSNDMCRCSPQHGLL